MRFRLVPKSSTLDDLELRCCTFKFSQNFALFQALKYISSILLVLSLRTLNSDLLLPLLNLSADLKLRNCRKYIVSILCIAYSLFSVLHSVGLLSIVGEIKLIYGIISR